MGSHSGTGRSATRSGPCATEKNRPSRGGRFKWLVNSALALVLLCGVYPAPAHNLQTKMVHMFFDPDTRAMLDERIAGNDPCFPSYTPPDPLLRSPQTCEDGVTTYPGDELGIIIKVIPRDGTQTGVGGHIDFYVPNGLEVVEVAYLLPGSNPGDGLSGYDKVPMKGQSLIATGDGPVGGKATTELIGLTSTNCPAGDLGGSACTYTNVNTVTQDPVVNASGLHRGTIAGVYGDTGIFYATDPDTAFGSWTSHTGASDDYCGLVDVLPPGYTGETITNNSGDTFIPCNKWDAGQMYAWGVKGTTYTGAGAAGSPIVDYGDGRGNAPWGFASGVAGPQSGYAWNFNWDEWAASAGTAADMREAMSGDEIGPWKRIQYPGSRISYDSPGTISAELGFANVDGSTVGYDLASQPLPITASQTDTTSPKDHSLGSGPVDRRGARVCLGQVPGRRHGGHRRRDWLPGFPRRHLWRRRRRHRQRQGPPVALL